MCLWGGWGFASAPGSCTFSMRQWKLWLQSVTLNSLCTTWAAFTFYYLPFVFIYKGSNGKENTNHTTREEKRYLSHNLSTDFENSLTSLWGPASLLLNIQMKSFSEVFVEWQQQAEACVVNQLLAHHQACSCHSSTWSWLVISWSVNSCWAHGFDMFLPCRL